MSNSSKGNLHATESCGPVHSLSDIQTDFGRLRLEVNPCTRMIQDNALKIHRRLKSSIQGVDSYGEYDGGILSQLPDENSKHEQALQISDFVAKSSGLRSRVQDRQALEIFQCADGKAIAFQIADLEEVIQRTDSDGHSFLQVNFRSGKKILLTQNLIGFKPAPSRGLDLSKLPKVVTTPDLLSVVEAIEDSLSSPPSRPEELDVLKKVFDSVMRGAEAVGFDTTSERVWLQGLARNSKASA